MITKIKVQLDASSLKSLRFTTNYFKLKNLEFFLRNQEKRLFRESIPFKKALKSFIVFNSNHFLFQSSISEKEPYNLKAAER